jgi:hypothetical protein
MTRANVPHCGHCAALADVPFPSGWLNVTVNDPTDRRGFRWLGTFDTAACVIRKSADWRRVEASIEAHGGWAQREADPTAETERQALTSLRKRMAEVAR